MLSVPVEPSSPWTTESYSNQINCSALPLREEEDEDKEQESSSPLRPTGCRRLGLALAKNQLPLSRSPITTPAADFTSLSQHLLQTLPSSLLLARHRTASPPPPPAPSLRLPSRRPLLHLIQNLSFHRARLKAAPIALFTIPFRLRKRKRKHKHTPAAPSADAPFVTLSLAAGRETSIARNLTPHDSLIRSITSREII